jgi:hypothetical protein
MGVSVKCLIESLSRGPVWGDRGGWCLVEGASRWGALGNRGVLGVVPSITGGLPSP